MNDQGAQDRRARREAAQRERLRRAQKRRRIAAIGGAVVLIAIVFLVTRGGGSSGDSPAEPTAAEIRREQAEKRAKQRAKENQAIDRVLRYTNFIKAGRGKKREVALTFDDGPGVYTPQILRILKRTNTPATFFIVGSMIPGEEKMVKRIEREGHAIGNHTQDHAGMGGIDPAAQREQLERQNQEMEKTGAPEQRIFRPPYRSFNDSTLELLAEKEMLMVLWDVDTNDYSGLDAQSIVRRALDDVKPGSIILMHDAGGDRTQTVKALPDIIKGLKRRNLTPVTVPRLVLDDPPPDGQGLPDELSGS